MITIDPLDDEVVKKPKPERSRLGRSPRSPRTTAGVDQRSEKKNHTNLLTIALRLLRSSVREEE
jgi:hypothetical protein